VHAVEQQPEFVLREPEPFRAVLELRVERHEAAIGIVQLAVGTLERVRFVAAQISIGRTLRGETGRFCGPCHCSLAGGGVHEKNGYGNRDAVCRRKDSEAMHKRLQRGQPLFEPADAPDAAGVDEVKLDLERGAFGEHELSRETTSCSTCRTTVAIVRPPPSGRGVVEFTMKAANLESQSPGHESKPTRCIAGIELRCKTRTGHVCQLHRTIHGLSRRNVYNGGQGRVVFFRFSPENGRIPDGVRPFESRPPGTAVA
jgi:hypothetical protein